MIDSHGRTIRDLRLSITDRCNFRCLYCMEPDVRFASGSELLSVQELVRVARICADLGVEKIRLTGGEPTVHPHLEQIIRGIASLNLRDLALTTNGSLLDPARLGRWRSAGLDRITISIDGLDPERFAAITRSNSSPQEVVDAIRAVQRAGYPATKINAVILRGMNEEEIVPLAGLARDLGIEMRYIEYMPLDSARAWSRSRLVPAAEILQRIGEVYPLVAEGRKHSSSTAIVYRFADGAPGRIGVIASVTQSFCRACSRLRITADGKVRPCLFSCEEWDLRPLLRGGADDADIARFLVDVTWTKQAEHGISTPGFRQPDRPGSAIGG